MDSRSISPACIKRLNTQGFTNYTYEELKEFRFGIRLAYGTCVTIVIIGLITGIIAFLIAASIIAVLGTILPNHPVDYLYNSVIRYIFHKPKLPPRPNQGKFACGIASTLLLTTIYFFYSGHSIAGYIVIAILLTSGLLVSTMDICIPSMIYNVLFLKKKKIEERPAVE